MAEKNVFWRTISTVDECSRWATRIRVVGTYSSRLASRFTTPGARGNAVQSTLTCTRLAKLKIEGKTSRYSILYYNDPVYAKNWCYALHPRPIWLRLFYTDMCLQVLVLPSSVLGMMFCGWTSGVKCYQQDMTFKFRASLKSYLYTDKL